MPIEGGIVQSWSDDQPRTPRVTLAIIVCCISVTLVYSLVSDQQQLLMLNLLGLRPAAMHQLLELPWTEWLQGGVLRSVSAMFLHLSWVHLLGNMAYLLIFGVPVERRLGHTLFLLLFLIGGALAYLTLSWELDQLSQWVIGASGGVSVVIGAYLGLFPRGRIGLYLPLGLYLQFARLPALLVIGSWFTLQLLYTVFGPINSQVAWWTHLAGFAIGLVAALLIGLARLLGRSL